MTMIVIIAIIAMGFIGLGSFSNKKKDLPIKYICLFIGLLLFSMTLIICREKLEDRDTIIKQQQSVIEDQRMMLDLNRPKFPFDIYEFNFGEERR